jgi:hypothetical protein
MKLPHELRLNGILEAGVLSFVTFDNKSARTPKLNIIFFDVCGQDLTLDSTSLIRASADDASTSSMSSLNVGNCQMANTPSTFVKWRT